MNRLLLYQKMRTMEAIGVDCYNQCTTGSIAMTLTAIRSDSEHVPVVVIVDDSNDRVRRKEIL